LLHARFAVAPLHRRCAALRCAGPEAKVV
jgi:hypothetical protein